MTTLDIPTTQGDPQGIGHYCPNCGHQWRCWSIHCNLASESVCLRCHQKRKLVKGRSPMTHEI